MRINTSITIDPTELQRDLKRKQIPKPLLNAYTDAFPEMKPHVPTLHSTAKREWSWKTLQTSKDCQQALEKMIHTTGRPFPLPKIQTQKKAIEAVHSLFMGSSLSLSSLVNRGVIQEAWNQGASKLLTEFKQEVLLPLLSQIPQLDHSTINPQALEVLVANLIAILPIIDLKEGEVLPLPQKINHTWQLIDYTVERLPLTPKWMGSPHLAYGLSAKNAPPLMLFTPTTFPGHDGFFPQILTDFTPFHSVGSSLFSVGRKPIGNWLKRHPQAHLYGMSLGAALSTHTAIHFSEHVAKVHAFHPPALMARNLKPWDKKKQEGKSLPQVNIYCAPGDIVSEVGFKWGKGWNIYKLYCSSQKLEKSLSHIRIHPTNPHFLMLKVDGEKDVQRLRHRFFAYLHQISSIPIFSLTLLIYLPYLGFHNLSRLLRVERRGVH